MTHLRLVWRLLQGRGLKHLLTMIIIALGTGMMVAANATAEAAQNALSAVAARFPLVVGGQTSAVPLVLGSLTRLQDLSGGVDAELYEQLTTDPAVEQVVPLLGGHAVQGYALLATSADYLQPRSSYPLADGRIFEAEAMEVVAGREAARGLGAKLGAELTIEHQHGAADQAGQLRVVGILASTGTDADRTLFCPIAAIERSHGSAHPELEPHDSDHQAISALLVRPRDRASLLQLQERLEAMPDVTVALTGQTLRRVADQLAAGGRMLRLVVSGVVLLTLLALLLSVYGTTLTQSREIAIMRVLGARRWVVVGVVLLATLAMVLGGTGAGLGVGQLFGNIAEQTLRSEMGLSASVSVLTKSTVAQLGTITLVLALVGIQPALAAYRLQAAEALTELPGSGRATRSYLTWSLRLFVPLALFIGLQWAMGRHSSEAVSAPLEAESRALFQQLATTEPNDATLVELDGQPHRIEGYMYALGDPFEVEDFHLVAMNPRLPRCPFCYRSPNQRERILVRSGGRKIDVASGLVRVTGVLHIRPDADDPFELELEELEVVIPE